MKWNEIKDNINAWLAKFFFVVGIIATIAGLIHVCTREDKPTSSPVEKNVIDSLIVDNDRLIIEVETLDSIKDAKIIEVKSLDNDSTLRLFYELIRK